MIRFKPTRMTLAVVLAVALILAAGGAAVASNMGFKLNKPITNFSTAPGAAKNENWISIPYNNPYGSFGGFCNQAGLKTTIGTAAIVTKIDPNTNIPQSATCGTASANNVPLPGPASTGQFAGLGFRVTEVTSTGAPSSIIIVGSHDPTLQVSVPANCFTSQGSSNCTTNLFCSGAGTTGGNGMCTAAGVPAACCTGNNTGTCAAAQSANCCTAKGTGTCVGSPITGKGLTWFSVPYHTTAVTVKDLCNQTGLSSAITLTATVSRIDSTTNLPQSATCFSGAATGINLVLGEAVKITEPGPLNCTANASGPCKQFIPAHF